MTRPGDDDSAEVDRAFAELIAGYHLTAEHTEPARPVTPEPVAEPSTAWADDHPLFRLVEPEPTPEPSPPVERYVPEPLPPLSPAMPALLGWLGIGLAALIVLLAAFGLDLPRWAGWLAVVGFVGGFAVLVSRLPRNRPPDAGDGAVL